MRNYRALQEGLSIFRWGVTEARLRAAPDLGALQPVTYIIQSTTWLLVMTVSDAKPAAQRLAVGQTPATPECFIP